MTNRGPYKTPAAFRAALTDKLRALAAEGRWGLTHLQRQRTVALRGHCRRGPPRVPSLVLA